MNTASVIVATNFRHGTHVNWYIATQESDFVMSEDVSSADPMKIGIVLVRISLWTWSFLECLKSAGVLSDFP